MHWCLIDDVTLHHYVLYKPCNKAHHWSPVQYSTVHHVNIKPGSVLNTALCSSCLLHVGILVLLAKPQKESVYNIISPKNEAIPEYGHLTYIFRLMLLTQQPYYIIVLLGTALVHI